MRPITIIVGTVAIGAVGYGLWRRYGRKPDAGVAASLDGAPLADDAVEANAPNRGAPMPTKASPPPANNAVTTKTLVPAGTSPQFIQAVVREQTLQRAAEGPSRSASIARALTNAANTVRATNAALVGSTSTTQAIADVSRAVMSASGQMVQTTAQTGIGAITQTVAAVDNRMARSIRGIL